MTMKIKILFYGFRHGHINSLYKRVVSSDIAVVAGCVEENISARENAEKKLGAVFSDIAYDEWLDSDIDAVAIGNEYGKRGKAIIKALNAGKHVIADKPICTDIAELEEIIRLSRERELQVMCMLDLRYIPQSLSAKKILDSRELGEVRNLSFNGQHCIDYKNRPSWYFEEGMHGGTINDLAIHGIDLVRMLTGEEIEKVDAARVWNSYAYKHEHFKDSALFMARLSNRAGVLADVSYSAPTQVFSMPTYWEFNIWCEKGLVTFNFVDKTVTVYREGAKAPEIYSEAPDRRYDWLDEFAEAIDKNDRTATENVFASTRTALWIQSIADKENSL